MVLGQDQRFLSALIAVNSENLKAWAENNGYNNIEVADMVRDSEVQKMYESEVASLVNSKTGFKIFERINKIALLPEEFKAGKSFRQRERLCAIK